MAVRARTKPHLQEIEEMGYYDFMGYLEVPFFNIGGVASMDRLAELLGLDEGARVLEVGCGTGGNACYLANRYGCHITGLDISEQMVTQAESRAEELGLTDLVTFQIGDAYDLGFPDGSFDVVYTVFVSQFLDPSKAFDEFNRVLSGGGRLGINEMYKEEEVPPEIASRVEEGERIFKEMTELPFSVRSDKEWEGHLVQAGFINIFMDRHTNVAGGVDALKKVVEFGGWWKILKTIWEMLALAARSKRIRRRIVLIGKGKGLLVNDRVVSRYVGYIVCVGHKP